MKRRIPLTIIVVIVLLAAASLLSYTLQADQVGTTQTVEDLGPIASSSHLGRRGFYTHPVTQAPHLLMMYDPGYTTNEYRIIDVNLTNQSVRSSSGSLGRTSVQGAVYHTNGKIYLTSSSPNYLVEYDPTTGMTKKLQQLADTTGYIMVEGDDRALYIGGASKGILERYDPATSKYENYGKANGSETTRWVYYLGADTRYIYAALGQQNWYLVVYDRQTGQQQTFWDELDPKRVQIMRAQDGWYSQRTNANGTSTYFKLTNGTPTQLAASYRIPPLSPAPQLRFCPSVAPTCATRFVDDLDLSAALPDSTTGAEPLATYRWKKKGETTWKSAKAAIPVQQQTIQQLIAKPDGSIMGATGFYGPLFTYNTATEKSTILGISGRNIYDMINLPDKRRIFLSGYPSTMMTYKPDKPWDVTVDSDVLGNTNNPHQLEPYGKYIYFVTRGNDGYVYGAVQHERDSFGSELVWYDPIKEVTSSLRAPFAEYNIRDLKPINNGQQLVMAAKPRDTAAQMTLFVINLESKRVTKTLVPTQDSVSTTKIAESPTEPGFILGVTEKSYYKIEAATGKVVYNKPLNGTPFQGMNIYESRLTTGPDGWVWFSFLPKGSTVRVLARINPANGEFDIKQSVDGLGNIVFQYNAATSAYDAYVYGGAKKTVLRRISSIIPGEPRANVQVTVKPDLTITTPGTASYTITARNTGPKAATNIRISYPIPAGTRVATASEGRVIQNGEVVWVVPTLAVDAKHIVSVTLESTNSP